MTGWWISRQQLKDDKCKWCAGRGYIEAEVWETQHFTASLPIPVRRVKCWACENDYVEDK
jgi:hypothetical protein